MKNNVRGRLLAVLLGAGVFLLAGCGTAGDTKENQEAETADQTQETDSVQAAEEQADGAEETPEGAGAELAEEETIKLSVSIVGDSISTFDDWIPEGYYDFFPEYGDVPKVEETWWKSAIDELGLELYVNASSMGSTCVGDSEDTESPQVGCNELRTSDLCGPGGSIPDIIIVYMGANDFMKAFPLGDNGGTEFVEEGMVENFSDAYTLMLDKLERNYPISQIYCCTLQPFGNYGTDTPYVEFVNGLELTTADYNECIREIAANKGYAVIELENCGIEVENMAAMTSDGVHPTSEGMAYISNAVKSVLEKDLAE